MKRFLQVVILVCAPLFICGATGTPAFAQAEVLISGNSKTALVFLHGYRSSSSTAFRNEAGSPSLPEALAGVRWSDLVRGGLSNDTMILVNYPANFCTKFTLPEIAQRITRDLDAQRVFTSYDRIVFVAHSFGGLVTKKILVDLSPDRREKVAGVVMLGTPADGAALADIGSRLPGTGRCGIISDLRSIERNSMLIDLTTRWRQMLVELGKSRRFPIACGYERQRTRPWGVIVPLSRIDGTCTESFAFDADHYEIASPDVGTSEFSWVADAILSAVAAHQRSMGLAKGIVNEQEIWISAATYIHGLGGTPYQTVDRQSDSMSSYSSDPDRQLEVASKVEFGAHFACSGKKLEPFGALAGGRLLREGTTTYRVESYLRAQRANAKELCFENGLGPYFYESTEAHFTAVIKTRVQVLAPVSDVVIGLEGMPRPDISISVGERQVDVEPIYEIKRSEDGAASYSGTVTFPQLGRDNYLLEMRFRGDMGVIAELTGKDEVSFSGITYIETR